MDAIRGSRSSIRPGRNGFGPALRGAVLIGASALAAVAGLTGSTRALAQDTESPARGITVVGYGQASAEAETAILQLVATEEEFGSPPRAPDPEATPGAEEREAVEPIVDGLVAAGVAEDDIDVVVSVGIGDYYGPGGPGVARIDVTVDPPTVERVNELINAAIVAAAEENMVISPLGVGYEVAECRPLEREAREAALEDARARAEIQAELLGVELGEPVASRDVPIGPASAFSAYYGPYAVTEAGCAPPSPDISTGAPITVPPFDPTAGAEVEAFVQIEVTFAIAES